MTLVERLADAVRSLMWDDSHPHFDVCVYCRRPDFERRHEPGCEGAALLREAESASSPDPAPSEMDGQELGGNDDNESS